jgi:hypothetical protein
MKADKIMNDLNIDLNQANQVLAVIKGQLDPTLIKPVQDWIAECYHRPSGVELKLAAINHIIESFGIEYIESVDDNYVDLYGLSYINLGDAYKATIMFDHSTNKFKVSSYGDIVENNPDYDLSSR